MVRGQQWPDANRDTRRDSRRADRCLASFRAFLSPSSGGKPPTHSRKDPVMSWKTPKIVEIALGAEINSYVCGEKK